MNKTKIERKLKRKNNPELVKTIIYAKKSLNWLAVANAVSIPKRKRIGLNLDEINSQCNDGDVVIVPGKVLSNGEIAKKIKISALGFSKQSVEKLKKSKISFNKIIEEIKENPDGKNIVIVNKKIDGKNGK
jgi:large subunit ribosomal protein L18e